MRWNILSEPLNRDLPYVVPISDACFTSNTPALLAYAIAWRETISGEKNGSWEASSVVSPDGGHGLFQLTSSFPPSWPDPYDNALYACDNYIVPDAVYWYRKYGYSGETLVRCVAASFNAGIQGAEEGHAVGDVGKYCTGDYVEAVLGFYKKLVATGSPV